MTMSNGLVELDRVFSDDHRAEQYSYTRCSDAEYQARWARIQSFMEEEGLDVLLIGGGTGTWDRNWNNTRWAVNHVGAQVCNFNWVLFSRAGNPAILTWPHNAHNPARRAREIVPDVYSALDGSATAVQIITERGYSDGTVGIVEPDLNSSIPLRHWQTLESGLRGATLRFVTREWWRKVRFVRSAEEIEMLEQAAHIGDAMSSSIADQAYVGMPERDLFACVSDAMIRSGGEIPTQIMIASGSTFADCDTFPRERAMNRVLGEGDVILTEFAPRYPDGSECQTARTYFVGEPSPRYQELASAMLTSYDAVIETLRPGSTGEDIALAGQTIIDAGYTWHSPLIHGAEGGGAGSLPMVRPPVALKEAEPFVLEPGVVLTVQVHPETASHSAGTFISDTWVITKGEPRRLNAYPRELISIDTNVARR